MPLCKCGCGTPVRRTWSIGHNRKGVGESTVTDDERRALRQTWDDVGIPYGYCQCGCGRQTRITDRTVRMFGHIKDEPVRYISGHGNARRFKHLDEDRGYSTPCWIWQLWKTHEGYGKISIKRDGVVHSKLAHRWAWEKVNGPIPDGMQLDHLCRQPSCVNPDHLEVVTNAENARRGSTTKLDWDKVREIRWLIAEDGIAYRVLAERYGVCLATISHIASGRNWRE